MIINRHNYEEFFILYLDNELSSSDRGEVELFIEKHPDLKEELEMLLQSKLEIDHAIVFDNKAALMKNYEESLVLYIDNELTTEQRAEIENLVAHDPAAKKELGLLQKIKLQPEAVTFSNKESLYRKEETARRIIAIRWWQVAAAVLLLFGGIAFFTQKTNIEQGMAGVTMPGIPEIKKDNTTTQQLATANAPEIKTNPIQKQVKKEVIKEEQPQLAFVDEGNKNNLPEPKRNITGAPDRTAIANVSNALTKSLGNNSPSFVTSLTSQSFIQAKNTLTSDEDVAMEEPEKKTKFRGLLRKITRTFEKTTNIKTTDEEDRLLVAGLAIRL